MIRDGLRRLMVVMVILVIGISAAQARAAAKKRILIVSSYHRAYLWSQATQRGLSEAMHNHGYLDNPQQMVTLATHDAVESTKAVIRRDQKGVDGYKTQILLHRDCPDDHTYHAGDQDLSA